MHYGEMTKLGTKLTNFKMRQKINEHSVEIWVAGLQLN